MKFSISVIEFQSFSLVNHTVYQWITVAFALIRKLKATSSAATYVSFCREAKIFPKHLHKKYISKDDQNLKFKKTVISLELDK